MEWWIAAIPITAILAGVFKDFLKVRANQRLLGASNRELEQVAAELKRTNELLAHRVENLETIVVSRTWNAVHDPALSEPERQRQVAAAVRHEIPPAPQEELNRQRAEQLARQLQR